MAVDDLPNPHVQLVFAILLLSNGMIDADELRAQAVSAFGADAGTAIEERLLGLRRPLGLR